MIIQWHERIVMESIAIATRSISFSENFFATKPDQLHKRGNNKRIKKTRKDKSGMTPDNEKTLSFQRDIG